MNIRIASLQDAPSLRDIYAHYVENYAYSFEYEAPSLSAFRERMRSAQSFYPFFACEEEGQILGFAYAHPYHERAAYQWCCEISVYCRAGSSRRGVGRALYAELIPALKKQGFAQAIAILGCPNEASEAFHRAMGFSLVSTLPKMGYKLGGWHDVKHYLIRLGDFPDPVRAPVSFSPALWEPARGSQNA
jgi:phosphinothricin acetyltransferase